MIHYTCDRCKRLLDPTEDLRYVVKMEVYAAMDPAGADSIEDDRDHLLEVHQILECYEDDQNESVSDHIYQKRRYDICPECHRKFISNPLAREQATQFGFSQN